MIELKKSTFAVAALIPIIVVAFVLATCSIVILYFEFQTQDDNGAEGTTPGGQDDGGIPPVFENPPEVAVTLSVPDSYLGDHPEATFTVTNTGGSCMVNYTIFEISPQTGSFSLGEDEGETITVTGPQVRDIGAWSTNVQVTATNSYGSDFAQASAGFKVNVEPFDAAPYINQNEVFLAETNLHQIGEQLIRILANIGALLGLDTLADGYLPLTAEFNTTNAIAQALAARHPNDQELQAKEIYYWVSDWISYDEDWGFLNLEGIAHQAEFPIQTISSRSGICINYALTLATLYEAVELDAELLVVWNSLFEPGHALVLLHYPNLDYGYYPLGDDRLILDPTAGSTIDWKFGEYHPQGWTNYDTADV